MATTTKAKEDDDDDKQMTRTISPPPTTTTATTAATTATTSTSPTQPTAALNRLKDLPPVIQDRQSSGGDESITSSTSFNPFEPSSSTLFLPLPNPSTNKSRSSFVLSNDELPSEIANADISIARDGSFVETSSGAAARELKKRYDEKLGVGTSAKGPYAISPYAITAFVNQHGKQMYRVGHRELSPPALSSEDADRQAFMQSRSSQSTGTTKSSGSSGPTKRRSRMSMHNFLPPTMFKSSHAGTGPLPKPPAPNSIPLPPLPPSQSHQQTTMPPVPGPSPQLVNEPVNSPPNRRLRRARSLSNMFGMANPQNPHIGAIPSNPPPQIVQGPTFPNHLVGRPHAHSVTGADIPRSVPHHPDTVSPISTGLASMNSISSRIQQPPPPPTRDVFSDVMGWNAETFSDTGSCDDSSNYGSGYGGGYGGFGWKPDVNVSGSVTSSSSQNQGYLRSHQGSGLKNPFGKGVCFDPPVIRERGRCKERSWSRSRKKGLEVDVDGEGSLGLNTDTESGEVWDTDEVKGYRYTDHLKIDNGHVLREVQSFESGLTARADPVPRQLAGTRGKELEKLYVGTSKTIPESEPEVDVAIVNAAVDGYESSGSSGPGSAFPPSTPVPARQTLPIRTRHSSMSTPVPAFSQETQSPSLETSSHSRYSTRVFDVLQSYRGIPLLDKLSEDAEYPETTVIRLTARSELNAAPRDDPRFVMWGEVWGGFGTNDEDGTSVDVNASTGKASRFTGSAACAETVSSRGSMVAQSPTDQTHGSKKGKKGPTPLSGPGTQQIVATASTATLSAASLATSTHSIPARLPNPQQDASHPVSRVQHPSSYLGHSLNGEAPRKVLIAATIERWIAQLTSELNYDELLIFFLTYRTYVSAVDLCHLLICRFHWALESSSSSPPSAAGSARSSYRLSNQEMGSGQGFGKNLAVNNSNNDDMVKRIVRVRTFIAIRYWLLTFFAIDFVPNRELRVLFGNWLNTLAKDPTLYGKKDIMDIVKKLKKVAKDCIDLQASKPRSSGPPHSRTSVNRRTSGHQSRKSNPSGGADGDSDVDLDFLPDSGVAVANRPQPFGATGKCQGVSQTSVADAAILQQPLHLAILSHAQSTELASSSSSATLRPHNGVFVPSPSTLPFHHKPLSRAFVNTIGRLGRWKRVLNPRNAPGGNPQLQIATADPFDVSPFNLEPNATGDLLRVKGGVEQYLKMIDQQSTTIPSSLASSLASSTPSSIHSSSVRSSSHPSSPNMISPAISLPGTPGISAKDIGSLHGGGVITNVSATTPVSPSMSSSGDRDCSERLGVVSEEPEDQDDVEGSLPVGVDGDSDPVPLDDTQDSSPLVLDTADDVGAGVQEAVTADVEGEEGLSTEENAPDHDEDATSHLIGLPKDVEIPLGPDSRPSSPESYDSEKSRRQAHESMMGGSLVEPPASLSPPSVPGNSGGRGLTRGGYQHRFQHNSYYDYPSDERPPDSGWQIDVVSIDELNLSDMSSAEDEGEVVKVGAGTSDFAHSPGLRRLPRKLPLRRDFEFIRPESVSSFGAAGGHTSVISAASSSVASSNAEDSRSTATGEDDDHPRLGHSIQQWQVNAIVDSLSDDEGEGNVETALNRLEGRINQSQQTLKQSKVDTWVKSIRERMANGLYGDEKPRFPVDESDEEGGPGENEVDEFGVVRSPQPTDATEQNPAQGMTVDTKRASRSPSTNERLSPEVETPMAQKYASKATFDTTRSGPGSPTMGEDSFPAIEDVVPFEILQSRVLARPPTSPGSGVGSPASGRVKSPPPSTIVVPSKPHRSFIVTVRAGALAEHLAVIERELFIGLKFEELVVDDWRNSVEESNILDWAQYLKDRARYKAEGRITPKTSALVAFRGRFNLFAKFVASEIVLTPPNERLNLVSKFIRVAWKLYERGAFNTLISLLAGLQSTWVTRALGKRWDKLGSSEARVYRDLRLVTDGAGDFRYLRQEVEAAIKAEPITINPHDSSVISADASPVGKGKGEGKIQPRSACIPFLGQYLSQLCRHCQLPDLIDPTVPSEPVRIDPETNTFEPPAYPEVFAALAPLPPSMQLEALINIQKQRRIAGVIKSLVTGQHLASKLQYPIDKKLFQRCLRLKALDEDTLCRVHTMYPT